MKAKGWGKNKRKAYLPGKEQEKDGKKGTQVAPGGTKMSGKWKIP
ncbi:hypothetical protein [Suipraeoptans intestinalis]|nr:hypothetical protein [Suipraeoptans intestinalis]